MERQTCSQTINNAFYEDLSEGWYTDTNHPIALLRAENAVRVPWIIREIGEHKSVLDIGCGAGFLTNALALKGHTVTGIDISQSSIDIAQKYDTTKSVIYRKADAYSLPFSDQSFDVVCAMDILEHVETPQRLISEAARVLKPNGLFFFHTFNRNLLSYLLIIKGVEWFVPNTPKNMHVYSLFIKPKQLSQLCLRSGLTPIKFHGFRPKFSKEVWKMFFTHKIPDNFSFTFSKSLKTGYCGYAIKKTLFQT
ncbi:MAG TPA: bifunctional 2-polyprenyl-6-hydroxyphenol methylase/3-demethylubiquinol 3-O-methyltransferase UbiG [Chlamydiales bacterium]|nr:bifunctional 2-polyprenyl-6-hydroxyphenol methylase/3-demethylubiquinol 3-O-methyltransferase UbiG [Chlamydiales bacterium]